MAPESFSYGGAKHRRRWENVHSVVESQIGAEGVHVWPFNPSFPIDVRAFVFGKHHNIRLSRHSYFELLYVNSGEAQYQVQGRQFRVRQGDLIVLNGDLYHRLSAVVAGPFRAVVLYFQPEVIRSTDASGEGMQYLMPFLIQDANFPYVISRQTGLPREILSLMTKIERCLPPSSDRARLTARTLLKMILVLLVNHYGGRPSTEHLFGRRQRAHERLRPVFEYLDAHFPEPISTAGTAGLLGMSKSHFMRFFKKVTGQSLGGYLHHFRIAKAQALLASTDKSISEVSQDVGFCDQSYFGLVFRRLAGMTPRDYRKVLTTQH